MHLGSLLSAPNWWGVQVARKGAYCPGWSVILRALLFPSSALFLLCLRYLYSALFSLHLLPPFSLCCYYLASPLCFQCSCLNSLNYSMVSYPPLPYYPLVLSEMSSWLLMLSTCPLPLWALCCPPLCFLICLSVLPLLLALLLPCSHSWFLVHWSAMCFSSLSSPLGLSCLSSACSVLFSLPLDSPHFSY